MNPLKKLAGQTAIYGLGTIVPRLLNYLLVPLYTRIFLSDEYGVITELYAYMAFLLVLLTYGMETSFFRHAEKLKDPAKVFSNAVFSLFVTTILFLAVILLFLDPIAGAIHYPDHKEYILYFSFIVALDAFSAIPFAYLRYRDRAMHFSVIRIISVAVNIGLNLYFLLLCPYLEENSPGSPFLLFYDPSIGVGYVFIANLVASILTLMLLLPQLRRMKPAPDPALLRKMLAYAFPLLVIGLAGMINEVADKIIFKFLVRVPDHIADKDSYGMGQLGIYGANYKLAVLMTLFIQMFRYAAEPFFFAQAGESNAKQVYADVMKYFVIFGLLIFLGVTLYIDIFKYFIGAEYWEGLFIIPIVLLANLFLGIFYNLSIWYKLNDITRYGAMIALTGAAVTIILNVVLVPAYSYLGAAWAHFFCYLVMVLMSFFLGRKHYRVDYPLLSISLYVLLALALFFLSGVIPAGSEKIKWILPTVLLAVFIFFVLMKEGGFFSSRKRS